ncbi:MAG TPA: pilus assembly protein CpaF, partial [Bdellovibrionales bacterium]|nr:pilus assembly protein CpaF [Bdellovibrionales bacterium]
SDEEHTLIGVEVEEPTDPGLIMPSRPIPKNPVPQATVQTPSTPIPANTKMPDLGPLDVFMKDPNITEVLVNDIRNVMIEKDGKMSFSGFTYPGLDDLNRLTRSILDFTGRILTPDHPFVDTSLPDGSRVNIVGPPLTLGGPCITIRKFPTQRPSIEDMIKSGTVDRRIAYFLNICVVGRLNIIISGGAGTGKTTLLNALAAFVSKNERIVTIEDTPELAIGHPNSVRMQTKPQSPTLPAIGARELLANALRMRPDRIIVGECRRGEALDMLQAMNTGHAGSMTTVHANSPRDALARLETLCLMGGVELPLIAIRKQMASAIDLVIQLKRFRNGHRHVVAVSEVTGIEGETLTLQDLFTYEVAGKTGPDGSVDGFFKCTGLVPTFLDRLKEQGLDFPQNYFG